MRYYPVYLDLQEKNVLVVGGGSVALDKIEKLLAAGARVEIVSPAIDERLKRLAASETVVYRAREFAAGDLDGKYLVVSATDVEAVNREVARLAAARNIPCNVVDQPALCSFIVPALVTRGNLQIAISTGGKSPTVAQKVKSEIENLIGDEYAKLLEIAAEFRRQVHLSYPDYARRRKMMREFIESDILDLIRADRQTEIYEMALMQTIKGVSD